MVPTFASKPLLGTNPIALAAPARPAEAPMLFDVATAAIAGNRIRLAMRDRLQPLLTRLGSPTKRARRSWRKSRSSTATPTTRRRSEGTREQRLAQGLRLRADGRGPGDVAVRHVADDVWDPKEGSKNHFAAYSNRRLHRRGSLQGHDGLGEMLQDLAGRPTRRPSRSASSIRACPSTRRVGIRAGGKPAFHSTREVIQWFAGVTSELGIAPLASL